MRIGTKVIAALGVAIVAVGGAGVAKAASGGPVLAGHSNTAKKTTTLKSKHGPALSLKSAHGPALKVNNSKLVPKLNAQLLGGQTASQLGSQIVGTFGSFTNAPDGVFVTCPKGSTPVGGGIEPDLSTPTPTTFVQSTFPHATAKGVLNGWQGLLADTDGPYTGDGFIFVLCSTSQSGFSQATVKQAGPQLRRAHAVHVKPAR